MRSMRKTYGPDEAKRVFYALANKKGETAKKKSAKKSSK